MLYATHRAIQAIRNVNRSEEEHSLESEGLEDRSCERPHGHNGE